MQRPASSPPAPAPRAARRALVRLQKFLAQAGIASRRAAEAIIAAGRVEINGRVARTLGVKVDPLGDRVHVDGQQVRPRRKLYVALHKPAGYLCSRAAESGARTVYDLLPREWTQLFPVGRLDRDSEGLLLLTNDGDFSLRVTHPRYGVRKCYHATVRGWVPDAAISRCVQGVSDAGQELRAASARVLRRNRTRSFLELELAEGKNREVRRLFSAQGLEVERLVRSRIGRVRLGELPSGKWRTLTASEIESLLKS